MEWAGLGWVGGTEPKGLLGLERKDPPLRALWEPPQQSHTHPPTQSMAFVWEGEALLCLPLWGAIN